MEFIRGIHNLQPRHHGCVLTIGNFDGFHRGHQALISSLRNEGNRLGLPVVVMIFEPQPQEYFSGNTAPARLTRLRDKVKYLLHAKVDKILCVSFNKRFATLSASAFIDDLLVKRLGVRFICVGDDFSFGAGRKGDFPLLKQASMDAGFEIMKTKTYKEGTLRISSTAIREALSQDRIIDAEVLLGHAYRISGRVVHGDAFGRTINFPTANISLNKRQSPINGVYAVEVYGITKNPIPAVANIGTRPTLDSQFQQRMEVHFLNIAMNLYGLHIEVIIRDKVRNEKKFSSIEELKQQIKNDVIKTRNYFGIE